MHGTYSFPSSESVHDNYSYNASRNPLRDGYQTIPLVIIGIRCNKTIASSYFTRIEQIDIILTIAASRSTEVA